MNSYVIYFLILLAVVLIFSALSYFSNRSMRRSVQQEFEERMRTQKDADGKTEFVRCPVCNTPLAKSENLVSKIFRPMTAPDQRMTVLGCPHCYPVAADGVTRACPVCKKPLSRDGYLVARLFNKPGKKHVIVTGCTGCLHVK